MTKEITGKEIYEYSLPPSLLTDNYIIGESITLEEAFCELLNCSNKFLNEIKSSKLNYIERKDQNKGENDYISDFGYGLDFKRISSQAATIAIKKVSPQIIKKDKTYVISARKFDGIIRKGSYISKLIRVLDKETIKRLSEKNLVCKKEENQRFIDEELVNIVNNFSVNKNIVFLICEGFTFKGEITHYDANICIKRQLEKDFEQLLKFRRQKCKRDTFIAYMVKEYVYIYKCDLKWNYIDRIFIGRSETMKRLIKPFAFQNGLSNYMLASEENTHDYNRKINK